MIGFYVLQWPVRKRTTMTSTTTTNNGKYLRTSLTKDLKENMEIFIKSYWKTFLKGLKKRRDIACSWIRKVNIIKILILP